ncbi:hypothetical protein V6N13_024997 [Hibiscus sabdariffa]
MPHAPTQGTHTPTSAPKPPSKTPVSARRTLTRKEKGKALVKPTQPSPALEEIVELDSEDDEEMPDAPPPPTNTFDTSTPRPRFKRKANRKISIAELAEDEDASTEEAEDNGSSTTPEETPMVSPPQSKAPYKRVATKPTPKNRQSAEKTKNEDMLLPTWHSLL